MIINLFVYSQNPQGDYATNKYSIIPPAPEVANLSNFSDISVSPFTGQPNIEIPIYTIQEGALSIPISLSYRGGGVKLYELPGIIGKGWSLNAGATISRTVYGLPDEYNQSDLDGLQHLSSNEYALRNRILSQVVEANPSSFNEDVVVSQNAAFFRYEKGQLDFANDIFKFYGLGLSGTFIYDENGQITQSSSTIVNFIGHNGINTQCFTLRDKKHITYYFDENGTEMTHTPDPSDKIYVTDYVTDTIKYRSAWHITRMESIYGDYITFNYSEPIYRNQYTGYTQYYVHYTDNEAYFLNDKTKAEHNRHIYYERNLESIQCKSSIIKFHYDTTKCKIDSITVHRKDINTTRIKCYHFIYSEGNLSAINQIGSNNDIIKLYGFDYIESSLAPHFYGIDHCGYYNGKDNKTLMPELNIGMTYYKEADREPSEYYAKQGILSKITYSTGRYTTFNWEGHDYSYRNGGGIKPTTHTVIKTDTFQLRGTVVGQRLNSGTYTMAKGDYFTIDLSKYLEPLMSGASTFQLEFQSEYETASNYHQQPYPRLEVYKDGVIYKRYDIDKNNSRSTIHITSTGATYQFVIINPRSFYGMSATDINNFWGATLTTDYKNYGYITITKNVIITMVDNVIKPWCGLRIANITSIPENGMHITKNYSYKISSDTLNRSSGVIWRLPYYKYGGYHCYETVAPHGEAYSEMIGISSSGIPSSTSGDLNIEYREVWESYSGAINGEIGYFYDTQYEFPDVEDCLYPLFVPNGLKTLTSKSYKRGHLKQKWYSGFIDYENNECKVYKKEKYDYSILESNSPTFSGPLYSVCDFQEVNKVNSIGEQYAKTYTINKYELIPYNKRVKSESVWEKDFYTGAESEQMVEYTYYGEESGYSSNPWNSFVKSKSYVNSRGQDVTIYYTYYKVGNVPLDLKELEIMVVDDIVVSARHNVYGTNHKLTKTYTGCVGMQFSSNFNLPDNILDDASYPAIDKEEYSYMYDSQGNIVQISYNEKVLASYLWGYMGKHPIVEAVGVSYAELFDVAKDYNYADGLYIDDMNLFLDSFKADNRFEGKEIKTYTYHWLLSMATSTDSRGVTNTYLLDDFGRLSGVKDTNGYYISKYDYNYIGF